MATNSKGKTVGCWLPSEAVTALEQALANLKAAGNETREGTYGTEAIVARLEREGYLSKGRGADVLARAAELVAVLGPAAVDAKLSELALEASAAESPTPST